MEKHMKNLAHIVVNLSRLQMSEIERETMQNVINDLKEALKELARLKDPDKK